MTTSQQAERPAYTHSASHNALLAGLSGPAYDRLAEQFEHVSLPVRMILHTPDMPIEHLYFLQSGVASLLAMDDSAQAVEVGTIGNEGMSGLAVFHGVESAPQQCFMQISGEGIRVPAAALLTALPGLPELDARLRRYAFCFFNDVAQSVACNRLHTVKQRCARWLLMTHDRVAENDFVLTHEFLSYMLAVRRSSVSVVARTLLDAQVIAYTRGRIRILDRPGLEAAACSCYRITRAAYDELLLRK